MSRLLFGHFHDAIRPLGNNLIVGSEFFWGRKRSTANGNLPLVKRNAYLRKF